MMVSLRSITIGLLLTGAALAPRQPSLDAPAARRQIAEAVGTDADAGAVLRVVLEHATSQSHREHFLASQIPDEWLPRRAGIEFERLSQADAVRHLAACGTYWIVERVKRTGDTVSLRLTSRCGASALDYLASFDGGEWRLGPKGTDTRHGFVPGHLDGYGERRPAECSCSRRD